MNKIRTRNSLSASTALAGFARLALLGVTGSLALASAQAQGLPTGGNVAAGSATIAMGAGSVTVSQSSQATAINWDSFGIAEGNTVTFVQPNATSVALNRVIGSDPSVILGNLNANGKVFLVNPNGVLFGQSSQVNVGGIVASTLAISDADFMAGQYNFSGLSGAAVLNRGSITAADGGYVALLGADVSNEGLIVAKMGSVALAAGQGVTLDVAGDGLLNIKVDTGAVNALVNNGGLIRADGGQVVLTAQSAGQLLRTVVNNTGIIEARTLDNRGGRILLLGDMQSGTANIGGTLDASAPGSGDGGFIETSAAHVHIADSVHISTAAASGTTGTWLIDPADFIIAPLGGNISGATLSGQLVTNNVVISTMTPDATGGNGDIFVNDAIAWTASGVPTTLTMNGFRDVNINAAITATNGNVVVCCGRDVNVNAPITTTNGSVLLTAGRDVNVYHAITTVDGNIALCAGHDVHIDAAITLTRGSTIPAQSLGLPIGLTLIAGADGSGPGVGGGTIIFAPLTPRAAITVAPVTIAYNPPSYSAPSDFSTNFTLTEGATLTQRMLLFPNGDKAFDGSTNAVLDGFNTTATSGLPAGVALVAGPNATATFASSGVGSNVGITYSGYTLTGPNADQYVLAGSCCVSTFATRGTISAAPVVVPPVVVPPPQPPVVVVPPVEPPVVVPPVVVPPVVVPPVQPPVVVPPVVVAPPVVVVPPNVPPPVVVVPPPVMTPPVVVLPPVVVMPIAPPEGANPPVSSPMADRNALATIIPGVVTATTIPQLSVIGTGVNMPAVQQAWAEPVPIQQVEDDRPLSRTGSQPVGDAFLPAPAPAVPVYPRKPARN